MPNARSNVAAEQLATSSPKHQVNAHLVHGAAVPLGIPKTFARNEEIYGETDNAEYFYKVLTGAVRTYKILMDGRRQIGAFYLPGDVFGLEAGEQHGLSAEAVVATKLSLFKATSVVSLAAANSEVARELWVLTAQELRRAQDHVLLLSK